MLMSLGLAAMASGQPLVAPEDLAFLRSSAVAAIRTATKNESKAKLGFALVTPGGHYPALWVRDFSMAAGSGLVSTEILRSHVRLIASVQNGSEERKLTDAFIPPFAIPDHINYDGSPVFYPGTYSSGMDQGGESFGRVPPMDDHYEFVHLAWLLFRDSKDMADLTTVIEGIPLIDRLEKAIQAPETDAASALCSTTLERRAVGFGFCDTVVVTGKLLLPSLLRWRSLKELEELERSLGRRAAAKEFRLQRERLARSLFPTFEHEGWLRAATGIGQQPDAWGTAFALYLGCLPRAQAAPLRRTLAKALREGTIAWEGGIRHIPIDRDCSSETAWERTVGVPKNRYQNGAYWHVPTGWVARAVEPEDPQSARALVKAMLDHLRREADKGAPWECIHPDGGYRQNPQYLASVTLPLEALLKK